MIIPTIAEGVVLAPIVINIKPKPIWKNPAKKPKKISWGEIIIVGESDKPIRHELTPATNCAGPYQQMEIFEQSLSKLQR